MSRTAVTQLCHYTVLKIGMSNTNFALGPEHFLHVRKPYLTNFKHSLWKKEREGNMYSKGNMYTKIII